jgi:ribosomal protein S27E
MYRISGKLLIYLTALLMALSPLQVTATVFSDVVEIQDNVIQDSAALFEDTTTFSDFVPAESCDQCKVEQSCFNHSCVSGQCTGCAMLLSPATLTSMISFARQELRPDNVGIARQISNSLFRPPKQ